MVELAQDRGLTAIVCSDIDPDSEGALDRLDVELKELYNGTKDGWKAAREGAIYMGVKIPWEIAKPMQCSEKPGRWHYVVTL